MPATVATGAAANCRACRMAPPAFVRAVSGGVYEGSMRAAIHALKYERVAPIARQLGQRLAAAIAQLSDEAPREMLVIPVPLHRGRSTQRGFNQARMLAVEALQLLRRSHPAWRLELSASKPSGLGLSGLGLSGLGLSGLGLSRRMLVRQRPTQSQAGLTPRQRRLNMRGAFFVSDIEAVRGRHILLVDDIYTTGATARACSQVLVEAGAASVRVATLARAQRRVPAQIRETRKFTRLSLPDEGNDTGFQGTVRLPFVQ